MNEIKLTSGEQITLDIIYPIYAHHVDLSLTDEECISVFDAIDQNMHAPDLPKRKSTTDMVYTYGNLVSMNNPVINKIKNAFLEIANRDMVNKYGEQNFKDNFKIHDVFVYGTIMASGTFDASVRHNYPWDYTAVTFIKVPKEVTQGEGALMFINRDVNTDFAEGQGVLPVAKHMVVFPSHVMVKDRAFKSKTGEIRVTLNCNVKYVIKSFEEAQSMNTIKSVGKGISDAEYQEMIAKTTSDTDNEW
jgi:hypothetical protein